MDVWPPVRVGAPTDLQAEPLVSKGRVADLQAELSPGPADGFESRGVLKLCLRRAHAS